jgi:hypothetical protein
MLSKEFKKFAKSHLNTFRVCEYVFTLQNGTKVFINGKYFGKIVYSDETSFKIEAECINPFTQQKQTQTLTYFFYNKCSNKEK